MLEVEVKGTGEWSGGRCRSHRGPTELTCHGPYAIAFHSLFSPSFILFSFFNSAININNKFPQ